MFEPVGYCGKCNCTGNLWELDGKFVTRVRAEDAERVQRVQCHVCEKSPAWWIDLKARAQTVEQIAAAHQIVGALNPAGDGGSTCINPPDESDTNG